MEYSALKEKIDPVYFKHSCLKDNDSLIKIIQENKITGSKCVEIGTYKGISAAILTNFFDEIYTFDVEEHKEKYEIWAKMQIWHKIRSFVLPGRSEIKKTIETLQAIYGKITVGFIDAVHNYNNVKADTEMLMSLGIKKILYHDADVPGIALYLSEIKAVTFYNQFGLWEAKEK